MYIMTRMIKTGTFVYLMIFFIQLFYQQSLIDKYIYEKQNMIRHYLYVK